MKGEGEGKDLCSHWRPEARRAVRSCTPLTCLLTRLFFQASVQESDANMHSFFCWCCVRCGTAIAALLVAADWSFSQAVERRLRWRAQAKLAGDAWL